MSLSQKEAWNILQRKQKGWVHKWSFKRGSGVVLVGRNSLVVRLGIAAEEAVGELLECRSAEAMRLTLWKRKLNTRRVLKNGRV